MGAKQYNTRKRSKDGRKNSAMFTVENIVRKQSLAREKLVNQFHDKKFGGNSVTDNDKPESNWSISNKSSFSNQPLMSKQHGFQ